MAFMQRPMRQPSPVGPRASVFAVGSRAYVACVGDRVPRAVLTDETAKNVLVGLADGTEVEILAWRPRGSKGARYCVRRTDDGLQGWLDVGNLRRTLIAPPPASAPGPSDAVPSRGIDPRRPFGQR